VAAAARLAAALSVGLASTLVLMSSPGGTGLIGLIGWISVALLAAGLLLGHRGGIVALSVGMILRLALLGAMGEVIQPDLWVQAVLLTLAIETAAISFTLRIRPVDPLVVMLRSVGMALIAAGLVETMDVLVVGTASSGALVRVAGVAALVLVAGWVIRTWRRTGLIG
jgi:hypothetical protein